MDCQTARRLVDFARPKHVELEPDDLRAFEGHIAACPECALNLKQERAFDEQLSQAMCRVDVPDQLRARLLRRLAEERGAARKWYRRTLLVSTLAAAALVLLAVGGWVIYVRATLPALNADRILTNFIKREQSPPTAADLEAEFRERGVEMKAPTTLNYNFLAFHGLGELEKRQVPCLVFIRQDKEADIYAHALVYVVSDREFNLNNLPLNSPPESGYKYQVEFERSADPQFAYVIVHTGDNLNWLRRPSD
jgi:hypothetical protein